MDDPMLAPTEHRLALKGLARINRWSGSAKLFWAPILEFARQLARPVRVLDIATGSGDVPLELALRAKRAGIVLHVTGCDVSRLAIEEAQRRAEAVNIEARFLVCDVLQEPLEGPFDVVICSLFLHHLDNPDVVTVLRKLGMAGSLVLVSDLQRSRFNLIQVWVASRLLSRSPVVHVDGPLSIRGAFTIRELHALAVEAGLTGATVRASFPCRMLLSWRKPA
jgi:2-polyprenyl-3-methyl-5-hydroxy-6-metoxy-1,4-benzoquinol methylase